MKIEDRINWVLESYFLKDMQKVLDRTNLRLKLTPLAKIENYLIEVGK
jgi:hypothetical protein